jgi:hypothetical protein
VKEATGNGVGQNLGCRVENFVVRKLIRSPKVPSPEDNLTVPAARGSVVRIGAGGVGLS